MGPRVPKPYDATAKELLEADPAGWVEFLGLRADGPVTVADSDVSTITAAVDKLLLVGGASPYLLHIEFQAWRDPTLAGRLLWYNVLIGYRHEKPVRSVAVLLRRESDVRSIDGRLVLTQPDGQDYLDFRYLVVRVWELPVESLLTGPLGAVPFAPLGDVEAGRLADVLRRVGERIDAEADRPAADRMLMATEILAGMRLPGPEVKRLFQEVFGMSRIHGIEESSIARELIERGEARGKAQGRAEGLARARRVLLTLGGALVGPPSPEVVEVIGRIDDLDRIGAISDRLPSAASWEELLAEPEPAAADQG